MSSDAEQPNHTIRAFIGLSLPPHIKTHLVHIGRELKQQLPHRSVRWTKGDNLHLTITFLGDGITAEQVQHLSDILKETAASTAPFQLTTTRLDCFPNLKEPRVLWIGLGGDIDVLQRFKKSLDKALRPLGWPPEKRRYTPHLTLGYVKDSTAVAQAKLPYGRETQSLSFDVNAIHLYQSQRTQNGVAYPKLFTTKLND